jgi:hypothetical protein
VDGNPLAGSRGVAPGGGVGPKLRAAEKVTSCMQFCTVV